MSIQFVSSANGGFVIDTDTTRSVAKLGNALFSGKMHMSLQMPESSTADGGTGDLRAAGMGCQGAEGGT